MQRAQDFDFIDMLGAALIFVWRHRRTVAALAVIPLIVKTACLVAIFALGLDTMYLRQGLVALPAYFAEGVFLSRLILMAGPRGETLLPYPAPDNRRVMVATLLFVLIKVVLAFIGGLGMDMAMALQQNAEAAENGSPGLFFTSLFALGFGLWAFRLTWLYIPAVQGYDIIAYLRRIEGFRTSFIMLGTWLLCFMPLALVLLFMVEAAAALLGHTEDAPSHLYRFVAIILQSGTELLANLLATLTLAFGVHHVMQEKKS